MVWLSGAALALSLMMMLGLVGYIAVKGLGFFWPSPIVQVQTTEGLILGEISAQEKAHGSDPAKTQFRVCNRDLYGQDYRWVPSAEIQALQRPLDAVLIERLENGPFIGFIQENTGDKLSLRTVDGQTLEVPSGQVVRIIPSNALGVVGKSRVYASRLWEFVAGAPRESNTEGGVFPAIFGTVMMVLLMSIAVVPLGVLAALFLREYARQGWVIRALRIAVNNLAGVPSIVFGIFGLGFFIYTVGGTLDQIFFSQKLPTPTFGTGGILWASLTLALLTVPVVIVSTEEALASVPRSQREASLALGATKWQTIW
ncbi:MAG: conserved rane protein of unknown function, partial [Holophagaceae bacterium]|nr:conserved rane protein of unknown function [Holophagaceae bacterium]